MRKFNFLIINLILFVLLVNILTFGEEIEKVYILYAKIFRNNSVELIDFSADYGEPSQLFDLESNYSIKIISVDNKVLFAKPLPVYFIAYGEIENEDENWHSEIILNSTVLYLKLPYFPNGKWINIYYLDRLIFSIDISERLCDNDGICERFETEYICERDCFKITETEKSRKEGWGLWIYLLIVVIIIILFLIFVKIKNREKESFYVNKYDIKNYGSL